MMVTFVSQCQKKSLQKTRRVLDTFADRIGDNTWQTVITQEGLLAVRRLLRKTASKNTAVTCHWMRSRSRSELIWIVGNKQRFNKSGLVPVARSLKLTHFRDDLADWHQLECIQSLASMAALLHDWGKASARFQQKLQPKYKGPLGDALRHEWVSCLLLKVFINQTDTTSDGAWLEQLASGDIDENTLKQVSLENIQKPLSGLPPIAQLLSWFILTHHRMPLPDGKRDIVLNNWQGEHAEDLSTLLNFIEKDWGYSNSKAADTLKDCLKFPLGLITNSQVWLKNVKRWSKKLLSQQSIFEDIIKQRLYRPVLHHARLCLMLGDL